jgi:hypothetical protein
VAVDFAQMQASVKKSVQVLYYSRFTNQLNTILHREGGSPTLEPKYKLSPFSSCAARLLCIATQLMEKLNI